MTVRPPSLLHTVMEVRFIPELFLSFLGFPISKLIPSGDGHPVIVLPGFMANDILTVVLRRFLKRCGYIVYGWKQGINFGYTEELEAQLNEYFLSIYKRHNKKISLVGWSLGGVFAREIARGYPDYVRQVITLGSPFVEPHKGTCVRWAYELITGVDVEDFCDEDRIKKLRTPPIVPTTAIYSETDGIAHHTSCKNPPEFLQHQYIENIIIKGSHIGLTWNPMVLYVIGDRLLQPVNGWKPFKMAGLRKILYK